ncbi:putative ankyrin repeat protein RF_0381 [Mytilus trossulus]|uniref:putative ankyrin repeat protein RF_0381 n=1 Tax=Mytilus trossulus TaxID=6551 RepID=UPI003006DABB
MASVICGKHLTESFITYAPSIFIRDHFTFESEEDDGLIYLSDDQEEEYFNRLLRDLRDFDITSTFHNKQLISQSFIDKLINFLEMSDEAKSLLKELDTKGCDLIVGDYYRPFNTTPLIESAAGGYFNIVHFLIHTVKCNVNKVDGRDKTPLYKTSQDGKTDIVNLLLQNNADVSYLNVVGESALYVACKRGNTDTVNVLLQNNADIAKCNITGESPLYVACKGGYIATVKLLIQNNADAAQCNLNGETPLYVACKEGHTDTVKLLLQNNADVSQCNRHGKSLMSVACEGDHKDTVELLIQNNADVSQCNTSGESPLYIAC